MKYNGDFADTRVLVTGGAGFIGSHLVRRLVKLQARVRVLDDLSTGRIENLSGVLDQVDFRCSSLADEAAVAAAAKGTDFVLHQAAIPSVPRSVHDPVATHEANVNGTLTLLQAARAAGVRRLVFASSSSVYGNPPQLPVVETQPTNPLSPYAVQKLAAEQYCRVFHQIYGLETVCLRYFNVFGAGQDPRSQYAAVIPLMITACLQGRAFMVNGDGRQSRDFTHVDNVVHANLLALTAPRAAGGVFNIACQEAMSLNEMLVEISRISEREMRVAYGPARAGDVLHSLADISAARNVLGYRTLCNVRDGLRRTYRSLAADAPGIESLRPGGFATASRLPQAEGTRLCAL